MAGIGDRTNGDEVEVAEASPDTESGGEAGAVGLRVLSVLATPLNYLILAALGERPMRLAEVRRATGLPAQTTLRGHLAGLVEIGALEKRPTAQLPYAVENELTPMGRELLDVARALEAWLDDAPGGTASLADGSAKGVVKAFVDGWGSTMMRGLGRGPMSLTELDRGIADLSYPALERRLSSMRMAGLIEACETRGVGTPYTVTEWARRGVAPLVAAGRCERLHMGESSAPLAREDIEAVFLLALPLVGLPAATSGACRLEVEAEQAPACEPAEIRVTIERGKVVACESDPGRAEVDFAAGSAGEWFEAVSSGAPERLRLGEGGVAAGVVGGLHAALAKCC